MVVLVVVCLIFLLIRSYHLAVVPGAFALLNLTLVLPFFWGSSTSSNSSISTARAMMMNVNTNNTNYSAVLAAIKSYAPDFLLLEEVNQRWMAELQQLDVEYPYSISRPRSDNFGIAFYSKRPFVTSEFVDVGQVDHPSVLVKVRIAGREIFIFGTHSLPPVNAEYARLRNKHLAEIPAMLNTLDAPVLLLGDLNSTPFSHAFKRLLRESGLVDGSRGMGYQPTWPAGAFPFLIPIDHCLHSAELQLHSKEIGPAVGSDHYPVIVDFFFAGK
jgi:endonuclease/exonuclease/phosphatase (EEP) superfamily protein YafD